MIETNDNFVKANDLMFQAYSLLMNDGSPLSRRDGVFAEEIEELGNRFMRVFSGEQITADLLRAITE